MVPEEGFEPSIHFWQWILSPLCIPVPTFGHLLGKLFISYLILLYIYLQHNQLLLNLFFGAPDEIRTRDPLIKSQLLLPGWATGAYGWGYWDRTSAHGFKVHRLTAWLILNIKAVYTLLFSKQLSIHIYFVLWFSL